MAVVMHGRRSGAALAAVVPLVVAGLATVLVAGGGSAAGAPQPTVTSIPVAPPNPSDAAQAQTVARDAAERVAKLQSKVVSTTRRVASASQIVDAAQARVDAQLEVERKAAAASAVASTRARAAQTLYDRDHAAFVAVITAEYEAGEGLDIISTVGHLLLARHPEDLIDAAQDEQLVQQYISGVLDRDRAATDANNAARASRAAALAAQRRASAKLGKLRDASQAALATATDALSELRAGLTSAQATQSQADAALSRFLGGWAVADPARAAALNRQYLAAAQEPPTGKLTHGEKAVRRALQQVGTPYAWAGGSGAGPSQGLCVGGGAENDCHVVGFDCSGLTLFAWAPYVGMPHLASAQYSVAGRVHPEISELEPGDLVFWSSNGQVGGIHHVALFIGDGNVVQAPQSGDIVRVTPLGSVDSGYFGATRPGA